MRNSRKFRKRAFTSSPDPGPYSGLAESSPLTQTNALSAYGAQVSALMDFSQEDRAPMDALNRVIWHAIKGAHTPYPVITGGGSRVTQRDAD